MRIDEFLAACRREWPAFDDPSRLSNVASPVDRRFGDLPKHIEGMATENKLMLLNLAVAHLEPGEIYVEIGSWRGLTLAGAAHNNPHTNIYACDDFSQFQGSRQQLDENLRRHTRPGQVHFYEGDFQEFLDAPPWGEARVGAYFYDGGHRFIDQYRAIAAIRPWLASEALLIIDDANEGSVRSASRLALRRFPDLELISEIRTPTNSSPTWWNGLHLLRSRSDQPLDQRRDSDLSSLRRHFFWDVVYIPQRERARRVKTAAGRVPGVRRAVGSLRSLRSRR